VFRNVMEGALRMMDVAPDNLDAWLAAQAEAEARRLKASGHALPADATAAVPAPAARAVQ
jgi:cell division protein FtsI (penicillin-binding protein 3)